MKHLKKFNESIDYSNVHPGNLPDEQMTRDVVDHYIAQIERATKSKVVSVEGDANESDADLRFVLDNGHQIEAEYIFHPFSGKTIVKVQDENSETIGEKSYGSLSGNKTESKYDKEDDVHDMIKDIYDEADPQEQEPSHYISFPKEHFGTEGYYYEFQNHPVNGGEVYFDSEQDAQNWLDSLKINILKDE